jgi:hypothetical protein
MAGSPAVVTFALVCRAVNKSASLVLRFCYGGPPCSHDVSTSERTPAWLAQLYVKGSCRTLLVVDLVLIKLVPRLALPA